MAVEKIATDEKDYHKWSLCFAVCTTTVSLNNYKNYGRHFKIFIEKGYIIIPWWVLSTLEMRQEFTGFPMETS